MIKDVFFKLKLKDGYLLKIMNDDEYEIHNESGNGVIIFKSRESLLDYAIQINDQFELVDSYGNNLERLKEM